MTPGSWCQQGTRGRLAHRVKRVEGRTVLLRCGNRFPVTRAIAPYRPIDACPKCTAPRPARHRRGGRIDLVDTGEL